MKLDDARVVVVSGAGEDQINGMFVGISSAQFPPKHLALAVASRCVLARTALLPQP